ncbi:E3 ubiquitin-protein ligase cbl-b [Plakobranchus ocellatus]|uniref:E3 ubiquitin-protein ligase cbl-b n=1 Tax=Plakobranchus ocellatus TaxID=259542 RepID=A0AAV3YKQ9_9GAST|nr:E3 ubiquitin-protein ligase cbl-b [Plakobranchus ocellatus]
MSLAILVRIAVPAIVAIGCAAYYMFKRKTEEEPHGGGNRRNSSPDRSRPLGGNRGHRNGTTARRRTPRPEAQNAQPQAEPEECSICMETQLLIKLHPCGHRSMCETCVIRIISRNSRACPFCRERIQGYHDA